MAGYPFDLGRYTRPASTASPTAQAWFDRGMVWSYGFNHEEAVRCFELAVEHDPGCALAHWGIAYAAGPNYNKDWDAFDAVDLRASLRRAHAAVTSAREAAAGAADVERDLVDALAQRFPGPEPVEDFAPWKLAYADAMAGVYARHPDDLDVAALYADAMMNLTPWQLWEVATGEPAPSARTLEIKRVLERAVDLPGGMAHPGLLHLYVHLMEMSAHPEQALGPADALRTLVPDAGHLLHMPTHIDVLCGDYARVVAGNDAAIAADDRYAAHAGDVGFYALYRAHDHHFRIYGAMFGAQRQVALDAAGALEAMLNEELLRVEVPPMADWLEGFVPMRLHVLVRFGAWDELIATPLPADPELYCVTTAMTHYGHAMAYAATSRIAQARAEREAFREAVARVPESRYLFNNTCLDILAVAAAMLDGELAYREGEHDEAFAHLRRAIELDDTLPYDEPWGWMQPTRHAYGALLLEQGQVELAEAVYAADLGLDATLGRACQHPGNVWSLHGYHECLTRLGKDDAARVIAQQLKLAAARADVPIQASCACRMSVA
jgi:tetratricopeptide (TPR) repeat protein